jgi:acetyl-CoA carboxylase biotin carboxyl carrier protein
MDIREIQNLIKFVAKSGATEVKLETGDFKITIKTTQEVAAKADGMMYPQMGLPAVTIAAPVASQEENRPVTQAVQSPKEDSNLITVKSPIIGTFYRKASPEKPAFVEVGDVISKGDVLCVIEAMKLFNEIESEVSGKIVKILVDNNSPVEFDQPLFLVDPS